MGYKVLIVYNTAPLPQDRIKTYSSWKKLADRVDLEFAFSADYQRGIKDRLLYRIKLANDPCRLNRRVIEQQQKKHYDLIFVVKGVNIRPRTVKIMKSLQAKVVFWSNDDMWGWHNRSLWFTWAAKHYDLVVSQKSYNCGPDELPSLGAKVLFQDKAYDPAMHYPIANANQIKHKHQVVFVGTHEKERLDALMYIAKQGIPVHVYGWGRDVSTQPHGNLVFHNCHLYGEDYCGVFSGSKICLNFLRKLSRDRQTSRSVEIPACRGFMLAERTDEHLKLFEAGREAEFFLDHGELVAKILYYLGHDDERRKIAQAGYERCRRDGYSFDHRMKEIADVVGVS